MGNTRAYLYYHTRLDTNQVFYIGIGWSSKYKRAYQRQKRSEYWKRIAKRGYTVKIVLDGLTVNEVKSWEKYLIGLYGRTQLNQGSLCNMTDGGDGTFGRIASMQERKAMSLRNMNKKVSENSKRLNKIAHSKPIIQLTKQGDFVMYWKSAVDATRYYDKIIKISECCYNKRSSSQGYKWKFSNEYLKAI